MTQCGAILTLDGELGAAKDFAAAGGRVYNPASSGCWTTREAEQVVDPSSLAIWAVSWSALLSAGTVFTNCLGRTGAGCPFRLLARPLANRRPRAPVRRLDARISVRFHQDDYSKLNTELHRVKKDKGQLMHSYNPFSGSKF